MNARVKSTCCGIDAITARDDIVGRLGEIKVPTLVVVGEDDKPLPPRKSCRIATGIAGAEPVIVPRAGHLWAIENPVPVTDAITRFLSKVGA
jgi:3-oxoadipate enol-lactonase